METAEKMFLVPQHQLEKLKFNTSENENIRKSVESNLDVEIRHILSRNDLKDYEKAKLYTATLQKFLNLVKLGDHETAHLTLSLPKTSDDGETVSDDQNVKKTDVIHEFISNIPARSQKNASYILEKILKSEGVASWNDNGEFVFKGNTIRGSHMLDLLKNLTASHKVADERRPVGWHEILQTVAQLNIPFSAIPNGIVRRKISDLKGSKESYPQPSSSTIKNDDFTRKPVLKSPKFPSSPRFPRSEWYDYD